MNVRQYVQTLELNLNQAHRGNCPVCGGKNTFTATSTIDGIKYNCYKAGCKVGGIDTSNLTAEQLRQAMALRVAQDAKDDPSPIAVPEGFTKAINPLYKAGLERYHLNASRHDTYYDVRQDRLCLPIKYKGSIVDFVGRSLTGRNPKWLRYSNAHVPYTYGCGSAVVLVEDCFSAIAAGDIPSCTGMALLGTNVLSEYIPMLAEYDRVVVALDPDARSKALQIVKDLRVIHNRVYALNLSDDLKYKRDRDIENLTTMSVR